MRSVPGPSALLLSLGGALIAVGAIAGARAQDRPEPPPAGSPPGTPDGPPGEMPEGHPPVGEAPGAPDVPPGEMPEGHPPLGSPDGADVPPEGHPGPVPPGSPVPSGHPPMGPPGAGPMGMDDAAINRMFAPPETATAEPAGDLPPGSIRVVVVDENDRPVPDAEIELGVMRSAGDRDRIAGRTGPDGTYVYRDLETGSTQAYRVNVLYEGATYSSTPFQLPPDSGYSARVRRLPVSHDDRQLLQFVAQILIETRDDRIHVIVQTQLVNAGDATYVFPGDGTRMRLPEGFVAFQAQAVMTDQHVEEQPGYGARIRGSLPPGSVMLMFAFDVPIEGGEANLRFGNPFRTMRYRVISEAPPGLELDVEGFPTPRRVESDGQILLGTELQRRPGDEPMEEIHVTLRGIPGPGPFRWIVLAIGLAFVVAGAFRLAGGGARSPDGSRLAELVRRREELLSAARALDEEHAAGEIGDAYRQKRRDAIVMEMAGLLYREDRLRNGEGARSRAAASSGQVETKDRAGGPAKRAKKAGSGGPRAARPK